MSGTTDEHTGAMADDDTFNAFPLAQAEQVGNSVVLLRNVGASLQRRPRGVGLDHGVPALLSDGSSRRRELSTCVADEKIYAAMRPGRKLHQPAHSLLVANVADLMCEAVAG